MLIDRLNYFPGLGRGAFSVLDAAKTLGTHPRNVRRWLKGYTYPTISGSVACGPAVISEREFEGLLSFAELIELFVIKGLLERHARLGHIIDVAEKLASKIGPLPLASSELVVVAKQIVSEKNLMPIVEANDAQLILEFGNDFFNNIDTDEFHVSRAYWPLGRNKPIILDATRNYGHAIVSGKGIPTETIYLAATSEHDVATVCDLFGISKLDFDSAMTYENRRNQVA